MKSMKAEVVYFAEDEKGYKGTICLWPVKKHSHNENN